MRGFGSLYNFIYSIVTKESQLWSFYFLFSKFCWYMVKILPWKQSGMKINQICVKNFFSNQSQINISNWFSAESTSIFISKHVKPSGSCILRLKHVDRFIFHQPVNLNTLQLNYLCVFQLLAAITVENQGQKENHGLEIKTT